MREQQHVADGRRIGEQHGEPIDADADASSRRHAVLERANVIRVEAHGLVIAHVLCLDLLHEALGLVDRIVELGKGIGVLVTQDE